jgi:hypothetical protein
MKLIVSTLLVLSVFAFTLPAAVNAAELEPFGMLSAMVGAERETGQPIGHSVGRAGARATLGALGVLPFAVQNFGLQAAVQYNGGQGSRFGGSAGPVYAWAGGKSGIFVDYQHRSLGSADFFWISPALAVYFDQMNLNLKYSHPISGIQRTRYQGDPRDAQIVEVATNKAQATVSYFPPMDILMIKKDNMELTFGVQVNTYAGHDTTQIRSAGAGPVIGVAVMPWQNLEVNLFKMTADNRSRYQVNSGIQYFFTNTPNQSLKLIRRKYLDAGPGPVGGFTTQRRS